VAEVDPVVWRTWLVEKEVPVKAKNLVKLAAMLCLAVILIAVALQNHGPVETRLMFVTVTMPQIVLLLLMAGGGFCLGLLVAMSVGITKRIAKKSALEGQA
jgi:uncharacterized integral membrane protein